jgi:hypothetical protein
MDKVRKPNISMNYYNRCTNEDTNQAPPEYKLGALAFESAVQVIMMFTVAKIFSLKFEIQRNFSLITFTYILLTYVGFEVLLTVVMRNPLY